MIGVICPSVFEYRTLSRKNHGRDVRLVHSGMGKLRAAYACHALKIADPRLEQVLLVGYAGGLASLKVGDVVEPSVIIEQDYNAEPFEKFPNIVRRPRKQLLPYSVDALMLTQDRFLKENPHKSGVYARKYRRVACDMESYAVAHFCREARLGWSVVKLVSDAADEQADHDFLKACRDLAPRLNETLDEALAALRLHSFDRVKRKAPRKAPRKSRHA